MGAASSAPSLSEQQFPFVCWNRQVAPERMNSVRIFIVPLCVLREPERWVEVFVEGLC